MRIKTNSNRPIGVFDSGLGGLTVVKELLRQLPRENVVYFGDTARVPYGTKSREAIIRFSQENVTILKQYQVKMVVVACNTSSSFALPTLRRSFDLPIVGVIGPGARKAVEVTRNKRVGVIATAATINSGEYVKHIKALDRAIQVFVQKCPLFVPLVEEGWTEKTVSVDIAAEYLKPLKKAGVDTLILGCTHYPLLKGVLRKVMGPGVLLVDSAQAVVQDVKELLSNTNSARAGVSAPARKFLVSDEPKHFHRLARQFLGFEIKNVKRCHV